MSRLVPPRPSYIEEVLAMPEAAPEEMMRKRAGVYHRVYQHDDWCRTLNGGKASDCNCDPIVSLHRQP